MATRPNGAESGNIIWELRKNPEFKEAIERNKTHPYNVLKRLVAQGHLTKRGKRYFFVKTEEPSTKEEGPSRITGGSDVPPIESHEVKDLLAELPVAPGLTRER